MTISHASLGAGRISTTLENIRRLAVTKQHLAGTLPSKRDADSILGVARGIGCIQLDPINAVAPSHLLVLWSRIGNFEMSELDKLLWRDKKLFEYWAHQASIVLMEDYPLYYQMMAGFPETFPKPWGPAWQKRVERWYHANSDLRDYVLKELELRGPLFLRQFDDKSRVRRRRSGWGSGGKLDRMLFQLFFRGEVMVAGRQGNQKLWDLSDRFLPDWVSKKELTQDELEYQAVQRSLKALGVASASEISFHFLRGRYRKLKATLTLLEEESKICEVDVVDGPIGKGQRYIHAEDLPLLEELDSNGWRPRTSLLSPFDNLICDRARTKLLFDFDFLTEIYVPRNRRRYGYYVLPILYGDRFIGRIDPLMDRKNERLLVNAVHAEPSAPKGRDVSIEIRSAVEQLSEFLGAKEIVYSTRVPEPWRSSLR